MKNRFLLSMLIPLSFTASGEWQSSYIFYGLGLTDTNQLLSAQDSDFHAEYVPQITLGVGKSYRINQNWIVDTSLSADWAKARFQFEQGQGRQMATLENLGLWSTTRLVREHWVDNLSPFVELGLGLVQGSADDFADLDNEWRGAAKAAVGVEFTLSDSASLSIALGKTTYDSH